MTFAASSDHVSRRVIGAAAAISPPVMATVGLRRRKAREGALG
jgi:hypothetical protein